MKNLQMVDLGAQYAEIKPEIDKAVIDVIESSMFINGPAVKSFQSNLEKYLDVKHVIPCANGTDALQVAMMALELKPGDEVITSNFTFAATVEVIGLLGLTPVIVDVDPDTFCVSPEAFEKAITPKTKAVVPVHLFGQCAPMEELVAIAEKHNIFVVEDNAQAIGSDYTFSNGKKAKAGTIGNFGTTSFFPSKNLGCYGDGGAIFTNSDELAGIARSIVNHGMGERYYYDRYGVNSRLDSVQAAILDIKLKHLDRYNASRKAAADYYSEHLSKIDGIQVPVENESSTHVYHQYTLLVDRKKHAGFNQFNLQEAMKEKGIPAMIYYPMPLHIQEAYKSDRFRDEDYPVTNELCKSVFSLPMHSELSRDQQDYIIENIKNYFS
jgi:dTDP-4-amino-4,6-dideoxygalactose transaminase